jgi:hypothetical protein
MYLHISGEYLGNAGSVSDLMNFTLWAYLRMGYCGSVILRNRMSWRPWLQIMIYEIEGLKRDADCERRETFYR